MPGCAGGANTRALSSTAFCLKVVTSPAEPYGCQPSSRNNLRTASAVSSTAASVINDVTPGNAYCIFAPGGTGSLLKFTLLWFCSRTDTCPASPRGKTDTETWYPSRPNCPFAD